LRSKCPLDSPPSVAIILRPFEVDGAKSAPRHWSAFDLIGYDSVADTPEASGASRRLFVAAEDSFGGAGL